MLPQYFPARPDHAASSLCLGQRGSAHPIQLKPPECTVFEATCR